ALLIPVLTVLLGILTPKDAFSPFADSIIFLFLGAFLLAESMQKHGWDKRIALFILTKTSFLRSFTRVSFVFALLSFLLSMWVSNSATTAMLCPIALGVCRAMDEGKQNSLGDQNRTFLLLLVAYSSSIGGIGTPVGSPPNLIAMSMLEKHSHPISFFEWVAIGLPLAIVMFLLSFAVLSFLFRRKSGDVKDLHLLSAYFEKQRAALGPLKKSELQVLGCFVFAVIFWTLPGMLTLLFPTDNFVVLLNARLSPAVVALLAGSLLFFLPVDADDTRNLSASDLQKIDWSTILLFGGGLALGKMLSDSGLASQLGSLVFGIFPVSSNLFFIFAVALALLFTEVASNTASASIFLGILFGILPLPLGTESLGIVLAVTLATSYGFMMPIATPPNAIVFGTGEVHLNKMIASGFFLNILGLILLFVAFEVFGILRYL
ncbi:MAG: DASS family sodium-coupled anion symporter, partial [Bdellovibrionales bacterium]|nr:DASS family sodium-coupled anion symporter [Bdellovibrionales bacterium]